MPTEPTRIEPEMKLSELKDGTIIEIIPRSEFWTSVVIVIIVLGAIPYLSYTLFKYYDVIKNEPGISQTDKSNYEDLWIGAIVIAVLLSIASIIFISFYFKNYTKRAFAQDSISIKEAFQRISKEIAQHAADEYSDEQVDKHMEDMATLGGRIMAVKNNDIWYSDPEEFKRNYTLTNSTGYRRYQKNQPVPVQNTGTGAPATVQGAINTPGTVTQPAGEPVAQPTGEPVAQPAGEPVTSQFNTGAFASPYVPW